MPLFYDRNFFLNGTPEDPTAINYDILGLHKERLFTNGFLTTVKYWNKYDGTTYADLAVQEDRVYATVPGTDFVTTRTMTISWFFEDGVVGVTKQTIKYYAPQEQIAEGKQRRGNVIDTASLYLVSKVGIPNAQDFLQTVSSLMTLYISGSRTQLLAAVNAATQPYMTGDPAIIPTLNAILDYAT
jgi:hypothetical protein